MGTNGAADDGSGTRSSAYGGVLGAFPYAARASDSWIFRVYVVVGGLAVVVVSTIFVLGLIVLMARTAIPRGGSLTLSRAFYVVVLLAVILPMAAPILLVARRRRGTGSTRRYDAAMGVAGFVVILTVYLSLLISAPEAQRESPPAILAPAVRILYDLPPIAGLVPPAIGAALVWAVHRILR